MADWVDQQLGGFCQDMQKQIRELPFLTPPQKQKFLDMLDECASKASKTPENSVVFMKRELKPMLDQIRQGTGQNLKIS